MKLNSRHLLIALVALVLGSVPALALAQSPFSNYGDAADDQYTPTATITVGATVTTPVTAVTVAGASTGPNTAAAPTDVAGQGTGAQPVDNAGAANAPSNDNGANQPSAESGANAPAAVAGANPAASLGAAALGCGVRYAWISFGTARTKVLRGTAHNDVLSVTQAPLFLSQINEPVSPAAITKLTDGTKWEGAAKDTAKLAAWAQALGEAIPDGLALAKTALPKLGMIIQTGQIAPVAGVVLTNTDVALDGEAATLRDTLIKNIVKGLQQMRIGTRQGSGLTAFPIVGVESTKTKPTTMGFFKDLGVPTVDDINTDNGQVSLRRVLDGARGHFGVKKLATDGDVAPQASVNPLLCRPSATYKAGAFIRSAASGGIPGGSRSVGILLLLGLVSSFALLAIAERRTRGLRRRATPKP
jgi:hypothetical protein